MPSATYRGNTDPASTKRPGGKRDGTLHAQAQRTPDAKGFTDKLTLRKESDSMRPTTNLQASRTPVNSSGKPPLDPRSKKKEVFVLKEFDGGDVALPPPIDHNKTVYKIFFLQGLGMMFPWNVYITAQSYYKHRFADTAHASNFTFWFSTSFQIANIVGLALAVYYGSKFNMRFSVAFPR